MLMNVYIILISALMCIRGVSAHTETGNVIKAKTPVTLLSSEEGKLWKLTSWTATHREKGKEVTEDMFTYFDDCENDNITVLFSDHTYQTREGASACNLSDKDLVSAGIWEFRENYSQIVMVDGKDILVKTIVKLNDSTIETQYTETDAQDGTTYILTEVYQAQ